MVMDNRIAAIEPRPVRFGAEVAATLRRERKARGLTLSDVARTVGTTPQTIQRIETNNMTVSVNWVQKICAALGIDPKTLMAERERFDRKLLVSIITGIDIQIDELGQLRENLKKLLSEAR